MKGELWRTAIHETGHVAMLTAQGMSFRHVTIKPRENYLGAVFHRLGKRLREKLETGSMLEGTHAAEALARVALAGEMAVRVHCGARHARVGLEGDNASLVEALMSLWGTDCPELQAHLRFLRLQTLAILSRPLSKLWVDVVATELMARGRLTRAEVNAALHSKSGLSDRARIHTSGGERCAL